ncbi:MAG: hypothetical protein M3P34_07035, partial [Actinomycetota bacterium]|nr:hypothetical protein [Actinomycetota bacterium]
AGVVVSEEQARDLREAAEFRRRRQDLQAEQVERLSQALPLDQLRLPFLFTPEVALGELDVLAEHLVAEVAALP